MSLCTAPYPAYCLLGQVQVYDNSPVWLQIHIWINLHSVYFNIPVKVSLDFVQLLISPLY